MTISDSIKRKNKKREPVWKGPEDAGPSGGVTQSLLNRFIADKERFRLYAIEGLKSRPTFNHRLEFGNLWHACEEALAEEENWEASLKNAATKMMQDYPFSVDDVRKWWNVVKTQFPVYVDYWKKHPDVRGRKPVLQEYVFSVPYILPNGRVVILRGKFDSVDLVGRAVWLQENKTKGEINELEITRQLRFDLQTMLYLVALDEIKHNMVYLGDSMDLVCRSLEHPLKGVRYNVIRRPFSGGKGSIKRHKPTKKNPSGESEEHFYARLRDDYIAKEPKDWFRRWEVTITGKDIENFKRKFLTPVLTHLCAWYDHVTFYSDPFIIDDESNGIHWQLPYGLYNPVMEGARTDVDDYLDTGSELGLVRVDDLFPELIA